MQNKTTTKRSKNDDEETQIITGMKNCKKYYKETQNDHRKMKNY